MASIIFKTNLAGTSESGASTQLVDLSTMVPLSRNTVVSGRVFTVKTNHVFTELPMVDFSQTVNPSRYSYTTTNTTDSNGNVTAVSFTVNYLAPLNRESVDDIITFSATAVVNATAGTSKIYDFNFPEDRIPSQGSYRTLKVYGDPGALVNIDFTTCPLINPTSDAISLIEGPKDVVIPTSGMYEQSVQIPKTTLLTYHKLKLAEYTSGTFINIASPYEKKYIQYPTQHTRLTLLDSALGTTLPATTNLNFYDDYGSNSQFYKYFRYQVYKASFNFELKPTVFDASLFSVTSGTSATLTDHTIKKTDIEFFDLKVEIDNDGVTDGDATKAYAVISGRMKIMPGYDAGGRTQINLDVNDVLKSA